MQRVLAYSIIMVVLQQEQNGLVPSLCSPVFADFPNDNLYLVSLVIFSKNK